MFPAVCFSPENEMAVMAFIFCTGCILLFRLGYKTHEITNSKCLISLMCLSYCARMVVAVSCCCPIMMNYIHDDKEAIIHIASLGMSTTSFGRWHIGRLTSSFFNFFFFTYGKLFFRAVSKRIRSRRPVLLVGDAVLSKPAAQSSSSMSFIRTLWVMYVDNVK